MEKVKEEDKKLTTGRSFLNYLLSLTGVGFALSIIYPLMSFLKPPKQNEVEFANVFSG